jgi:hypothetical protein
MIYLLYLFIGFTLGVSIVLIIVGIRKLLTMDIPPFE